LKALQAVSLERARRQQQKKVDDFTKGIQPPLPPGVWPKIVPVKNQFEHLKAILKDKSGMDKWYKAIKKLLRSKCQCDNKLPKPAGASEPAEDKVVCNCSADQLRQAIDDSAKTADLLPPGPNDSPYDLPVEVGLPRNNSVDTSTDYWVQPPAYNVVKLAPAKTTYIDPLAAAAGLPAAPVDPAAIAATKAAAPKPRVRPTAFNPHPWTGSFNHPVDGPEEGNPDASAVLDNPLQALTAPRLKDAYSHPAKDDEEEESDDDKNVDAADKS